ncbi:GlsB/YeaQ/YmgE family stress response membrane protein [Agrococcus casei]|uniref:Transglycosylase-associated protein n=2 Tax=Agrococcus TaxID=46352 RepID=A0A1R4FMQ1_9MICO|nr:GlsB/YeaQ/YmgE family stress response membrane protein [Agrococcus casei]SJM57205.1 Transglycosylase-associated protein [Agrococcus casei LMG 22410]
MDLSFIGWIVIGLAAGALAKLILPGKQGGGFFVTLLLGVVGALLGGWIGSMIGVSGDGVFSIWTWVLAVGGAIIVLLIWGLIFGRKKSGSRD